MNGMDEVVVGGAGGGSASVSVSPARTLNRRARLRSGQGQKDHAWEDFGPVPFMEAAKAYCQAFAGPLMESGDIEPGKPFFVQVSEIDEEKNGHVPSCVFMMQERVEYDIINPRLGSD